MKTLFNKSTLINLRVIGLLYLISLLIPTLNWVLILSSEGTYANKSKIKK